MKLYRKICWECKRVLYTERPRAVLCSNECKKERRRKSSERHKKKKRGEYVQPIAEIREQERAEIAAAWDTVDEFANDHKLAEKKETWEDRRNPNLPAVAPEPEKRAVAFRKLGKMPTEKFRKLMDDWTAKKVNFI